jgi:hypothetical protein
MDIARGLTIVALIAVGLVLAVRGGYRLLRWARSGTGGAHVLGAVLTEVTESRAVHEAKEGEKRRNNGAGDPPNEE